MRHLSRQNVSFANGLLDANVGLSGTKVQKCWALFFFFLGSVHILKKSSDVQQNFCSKLADFWGCFVFHWTGMIGNMTCYWYRYQPSHKLMPLQKKYHAHQLHMLHMTSVTSSIKTLDGNQYFFILYRKIHTLIVQSPKYSWVAMARCSLSTIPCPVTALV